MKAEEYKTEIKEVHGVSIEVRSYKIGNEYYCHISNTNPGATIARGSGTSRDEAVHSAFERARERLK